MEKVRHALATLVGRPDVAGAALVSGEGLLVASQLPDGADGEAVAALAASLLRDAAQLAHSVGRRAPERLVFDSADGLFLACALGQGAVLLVLAQPDAPGGALLFHLRQQHASLAALLHPSVPG